MGDFGSVFSGPIHSNHWEATMINPFGFATSTEILFGRGMSELAPRRIAGFGKDTLVVLGKSSQRAQWLIDGLRELGCAVRTVSIPAEPSIDMIEAGRQLGQGCDVVVAIGGGAAIDAGKAIAALIPSPHGIMYHLEVVGEGKPLDTAPLPFVAIPTTAGTGAEVTKNAVISVPDHKRKVSMRDLAMLPKLAMIDPALTDNSPRSVTLSSGLDAITQVIEPYVCTKATPLTDALCRDAIPRGLRSLRRLMEAEDPQARDELAYVSLCGGLALANSGLGVIHGLAGPLGGLANAPHGAICGTLLPYGLALNEAKVTDRQLKLRLIEVREVIANEFEVSTEDAFETLSAWSRQNGLPGLDGLGISEEDRVNAANAAATSSSMKANPAALSSDDLIQMMEKAL